TLSYKSDSKLMQKDYCSNTLYRHRYLLVLICCCIFLFGLWPAELMAQNNASVDRDIKLKAISGLKFDKVRLVVEPGTKLRITLTNADEMMHNMLIVEPETRVEVVEQVESLGEEGAAQDFVPENSNVLAYTPLLEPGDKA